MAWNILGQWELYKQAFFTLNILQFITIIYALIRFFNICCDVRCMKMSWKKVVGQKLGGHGSSSPRNNSPDVYIMVDHNCYGKIKSAKTKVSTSLKSQKSVEKTNAKWQKPKPHSYSMSSITTAKATCEKA